MTPTATILFCANQGFAIRYFFKSEVFQTLLKANTRVVVLSRYSDHPAFVAEFSSPNVVFEKLDESVSSILQKSKRHQFFYYFRTYGINTSLSMHQKMVRQKLLVSRAKLSTRARLHGLALFLALVQRSPLLRRILTFADNHCNPEPAYFEAILNKHKPDAVVAASLGFIFPDIHVSKVARKLKIPVIIPILSWDNPTTKGLCTLVPDLTLTWTETMRQELIEIHGLPARSVKVAGVAHFDVHARPLRPDSQSELNAELNLTPDEKLIFLGAGSPTYQHEINLEIIQSLLEGIKSGKIHAHRLMVRLHPNYMAERRAHKCVAMLKALETFKRDYGRTLIVDMPSQSSENADWFAANDDLRRLSLLLRRSAVMVNFFSTLILEAAIVDLPIVNISWDAAGSTHLRSNSAISEYPYIKRMFATGGVDNVPSPSALIDAVNRALNFPQERRAGRKKIVAAECGPNLGTAGESIGRLILETVRTPAQPILSLAPRHMEA